MCCFLFFFFCEVKCLGGCFFFFQAEDGIRDADVTGVQTCALPICRFLAYSFPPCSPDPHHLAVLARPGFVRAAPALPGTTRIRLPPASPPCCDRTAAKVSHLHSNKQRLTAQRDVPPAGTPLQRERDVIAAGEPRQPAPQMHAVSRGDLAPLHLPGRGVQVVERELLPVNVEPAYDGHRDLLKLRRGRKAPARNAYAVNRDASELGRSRAQKAPASAQPGPMHVIYTYVPRGLLSVDPRGQPRTLSATHLTCPDLNAGLFPGPSCTRQPGRPSDASPPPEALRQRPPPSRYVEVERSARFITGAETRCGKPAAQAIPEALSGLYPGVRNRSWSWRRRMPILLPSMIG